MNRLWEPVISPIFKFINPKVIVEIGAEKGINTENILKYCLNHDAKLISIDPNPLFDINKFKLNFGEKFTLLNELSLNCLQYIGDYDCILIDGDHNYFTVFNELLIIGEKFNQDSFPIIFLHDVGWPYGRRDLYYNPENIPKEFLNDYSRLGMYPGKSELLAHGGLNSNLLNANDENTPNNGVLTAIEDFINHSSLDLDFHLFSPFHGLGIIHRKDENLYLFIENLFKSDEILNFVEMYYIKKIIHYENNMLDSNEKIELLNDNVDNFRNEMIKLNNINNDNLEVISELNNKLSEVNNQLDFKDSQLDELNSRFNSLNDDFINIENLNNELTLINNKLQKQNAMLSEINEKQYAEIIKLKEDCENFEKFNDNQSNIIDELTLVNKKLQKRNISLSKTKKEQYSSFLKLKKYSDDLEKRNTALSITKKELFDKMIKLNSNINSLKNMVSYYDNEIVSLSEKLDNQTKNYEELNEMFAKTVTKKYLLEDENNYLRDSYQDTKSTLDSVLNSRSWKYSSVFRKFKLIFKNK